MVSDGNADQTDALHNHTLGKFLVTFGDVQSTDDLPGGLHCLKVDTGTSPPLFGVPPRGLVDTFEPLRGSWPGASMMVGYRIG